MLFWRIDISITKNWHRNSWIIFWAICDQSEWPLYIWARVLACMLKAATPISCKRSATSSILIELSSQPKRFYGW
jgi:hypothetical protein